MELQFLGTGSAFCNQKNNWQSNMLLSHKGKNMLIDCGSDVRHSLDDQNMNHKDISAVYISHLHADHIGGLEWLAFCSYFDPTYEGKPELYCHCALLDELWDKSLKGGLEGIEGKCVSLKDYFDLKPLVVNESFEWQGISMDMVQALHVSSKYKILDSYGLMFTALDKRVYITTDCQFAPETSMKAYYAEADIIYHDCETMYKSGVHSHYDDLCTLKPDVKGKMWLYHYQDNVASDMMTWNEKALKDGFLGFVDCGEIFSFSPESEIDERTR